MNRRDFLKSLPFIGALATAIFWRKPSQDAVTAYSLDEYAKEMGINLPAKSVVVGPHSGTRWSVVNLGQPVIDTITWNNRIYAVGANGDIWMSDDHFATWVKVEAIDSSVPHRYYPRPNRLTC